LFLFSKDNFFLYLIEIRICNTYIYFNINKYKKKGVIMQKESQIYCDPNQDRSEQERHLEEAYKEAKERTIRQLIAMILALIVSAVIYATIQYFRMY